MRIQALLSSNVAPRPRALPVLGLTLLIGVFVLPMAGARTAATAPEATAESEPKAEPSFVVVVSASNPRKEISRKEVERIFLKRIRSWPDGEWITPVDQARTLPIRQAFTAAVHKKEVNHIVHYWTRLTFSGREVPPPELGSDQAVLRHVGGHPGGIGYVAASTLLGPDVKALAIVAAAPAK